MALYWLVERRVERRHAAVDAPLKGGPNGFALIFQSHYLIMICLLLLVLNLVNTTGEYVLSSAVLARANDFAAANPAFDKSAYIGAFYGNYFFWVNVVAACSPCNLRKGNLTMAEAKMYPSQMPFQPSVHHLHRNGRLFPPNYLHDSWLYYLYWDTELEP